MALQGKIIELAPDRYGFEYRSPLYNEPKEIRQVWAIEAHTTRGMSWCQPSDAIGKPASITDGKVSCYLGNSNYFAGVLKDGGATKSILTETLPIPRPKVRTELRWYNGQWQKLMRKGWIAA